MVDKFDPNSLKVRLTLGIALFATLGLGGLASWIGMRMQYILVATQKENIKYIAQRFPQDVKIYSDMVSLEEGMQKAINNLSDHNRVFWVKSDRGMITARSPILQNSEIAEVLLPLNNVPLIPQIRDLQGRYWLLCATTLQIKGVNLGQFYIAQDITQEQKMLSNLLRSIGLATLIAITIMIGAIALYIHRSLQPLKRISQLSAKISADKLIEAQINLKNPPSEVRELAETLQEMLMRLSQSWEHQRQLLSNVSHELRTPLTIICGYLESTLRRGQNLTEIQKEALTTAANEANRTVNLLQDLLDLSRADSGTMHFQLKTVDVKQIVAEVVMMTTQYSNQPITFNSEDRLMAIAVDSNRFKQILLNLIDNAIKYSAPQQPITINSRVQENWVLVEISDRGVGIPLQQQARIFERFYRIDEARNRAGGTGLGLAIVKTLVEGMGGKISVQSQPQKGSTFTLSFPLINS